MHKSQSTASLLMFKAEAKRLHKSILNKCPSALSRLAHAGFHNLPQLNHTACLGTLAKEYGYDSFQELVYLEQLIFRFIQINFASGLWRTVHSRAWSTKLFEKQYAAIHEAAIKNIPLAKAAKTRGIDFQGFQFSGLLYSRLCVELDILPQFDFSELDACGSYIESAWTGNAISFEKAKLAHAKFFQVYVDPSVAPGISMYRGNFRHTDLRGADFRTSYLRGSDFVGADLEDTDFRGANIFECRFTEAKGKFQAGGAHYNEAWVVSPKGRYRS